MKKPRTPSIETIKRRREAEDARLRARLAVIEARKAELEAEAATIKQMLAWPDLPAAFSAPLAPVEPTHVTCADCGSYLPFAQYEECPGCHASPFEARLGGAQIPSEFQ